MGSRKNTKIKDNRLQELNECYIHPFITVEEFILGIKNEPTRLFYDFNFKYALEKLTNYLNTGIQCESSASRSILKEAGLQAFINPNSSIIKTKDRTLNWYKNNLYDLFNKIEKIEMKIRPYWIRNSDQKQAIKEVLNETDINATVKLISDIYLEVKSPTDLALMLFSMSTKISYYALHKLYYDSGVAKKREEYKERKNKKGVEFKDLMEALKNKTPLYKQEYNINYKTLNNNPSLVIYLYYQSYQQYRFFNSALSVPFLSSKKNSQSDIK